VWRAANEHKTQARRARRVRQAQHEAARQVITWAAGHRIGTLVVGDPPFTGKPARSLGPVLQ
jgi:hypothetical protein